MIESQGSQINQDKAPEGSSIEALCFGFLGGISPLIAQYSSSILKNGIPISNPDFSYVLVGLIYGIFGLLFTRMSGEKKLVKAFALGVSAPGFLLSITTAKAEPIGNFGVFVRASYSATITPPVTVLANVTVELPGSNTAPDSKIISFGTSTHFSSIPDKDKIIKITISNKSAYATTNWANICVSVNLLYVTNWKTALGIYTAPEAQRIIITNASTLENCRFASLLMVMAGSVSSEERKSAGQEVANTARSAENVNSLAEQWEQFLVPDIFKSFGDDGKFNLVSLLDTIDTNILSPEARKSLFAAITDLSTRKSELMIGTQTAQLLNSAQQKLRPTGQ